MIEHGGNVEKIAKQLGKPMKDLIDFSANINPLGIPMTLKQGIYNIMEQLIHYPDIDYSSPKQAIAKHENIPFEQVIVSNGAAQAFFEIANVLKPKRLFILAPTFLEYQQAFETVETEIVHMVLDEKQGYQWHYDTLYPYLKDLNKTDVVLLCNPNNPTGSLVSQQELLKIAKQLQEKHVPLIIDEAFIDFVFEKEKYTFVPFLKQFNHTIVVKSMTKFYAVPGIRLGYIVTFNRDWLTQIENKRVPWSVNTIAAKAVPLLLEDVAYQKSTQEWIATERVWLYEQLKQFFELNVIEPSVNYIFFSYEKNDLKEKLAEKNILIRSCANYPYLTDKHYRVAVKSRADNEKLVRALKEVIRA